MGSDDLTIVAEKGDIVLSTKVPYVIFVYLNENGRTDKAEYTASILLGAHVKNVIIVSSHGNITREQAYIIECKYCTDYKIVRLCFGEKVFDEDRIQPINGWFGFNPKETALSKKIKRQSHDIVEDAIWAEKFQQYEQLGHDKLRGNSFNYNISEVQIMNDGCLVTLSVDKLMIAWLALHNYCEYCSVLPTFVKSLEIFLMSFTNVFTINSKLFFNMPESYFGNMTGTSRYCISLLKFNYFKKDILTKYYADALYSDFGFHVEDIKFCIEYDYDESRRIKSRMMRWGKNSGAYNYTIDSSLRFTRNLSKFLKLFKTSFDELKQIEGGISIPDFDDLVRRYQNSRFDLQRHNDYSNWSGNHGTYKRI